MTTKMKGLLKGLRYISQIFDNDEKEPEMMIGLPTDVKHVAHIGWDGPTVTSPSRMNEFKSSPRHSAPLDAIDNNMFKDDPNLQASEGSRRGGARSQCFESSTARELPDLQKSTRRHSSTEASSDSPTKAKSERVRPPRRSSKNGKDTSDSSKQQPEDEIGEVHSPTRRHLPDMPNKSRRKKSKDSRGGSTRPSSRSKTKASPNEAPFSNPGTSDGTVSNSRMEDVEEDKHLRGPATPDRHL